MLVRGSADVAPRAVLGETTRSTPQPPVRTVTPVPMSTCLRSGTASHLVRSQGSACRLSAAQPRSALPHAVTPPSSVHNVGAAPDLVGHVWRASLLAQATEDRLRHCLVVVEDCGFPTPRSAGTSGGSVVGTTGGTTEPCPTGSSVRAGDSTLMVNVGGLDRSFLVHAPPAYDIAGVAPVDFDCVDGAACGDCAPTRPVTVVQFRGTSDTLVPYEGGNAFSGAQNNFATWGDINTCSGTPMAHSVSAACEGYPACEAGVETLLCTVEGGTHCGSYRSFMIPEFAWEVLQEHTL